MSINKPLLQKTNQINFCLHCFCGKKEITEETKIWAQYSLPIHITVRDTKPLPYLRNIKADCNKRDEIFEVDSWKN